jgi:hypothetical protein
VRHDRSQALPPPSGTPTGAQEFVLHALCAETHDLLDHHRDELLRLHQERDRGLKNVAGNDVLGYALHTEIGRLKSEARLKQAGARSAAATESKRSQVRILVGRSRLENL